MMGRYEDKIAECAAKAGLPNPIIEFKPYVKRYNWPSEDSQKIEMMLSDLGDIMVRLEKIEKLMEKKRLR